MCVSLQMPSSQDLVLYVGRTLAWERLPSMRAHPKLTERAYRPATPYYEDLVLCVSYYYYCYHLYPSILKRVFKI